MSKEIKLGYPDSENLIAIESAIIKYWQDNPHQDGSQMLEINTCDLGGGHFFEISTEKWSFDSVDDLIKVLQDFKKRTGV
jgi:hypothetical protein